MKRKISCTLIILIITALLSNIVAYAANPATDAAAIAERLSSMRIAAENDKLELYLDESNTEIAVKNKDTGKIWFSNPIERQKLEDYTAQAILGAHVSIIYYDNTGVKLEMASNTNSVEAGTYKIKDIPNGIRIEYTLKNRVDLAVGSKPKLPEYKGKKGVEIEIVEDAGTSWGFMERNKYDVIYMEKDELLKQLQDQIFFIPVEYTLQGDDFIARIPCNEVKHPENYPLSEIKFLQFFGAAHYQEKGYMFIPDGSGGLIDFAKQTGSGGNLINKELYGEDYSNLKNEKLVWQEQGVMPVFGLAKPGDNAFTAIIEDGDATASVTAEISNYNHNYNSVYANFNVTPLGTITLTGAANPISTAVYQERMYKGDIKIRYSFLEGKDANYVGMAKNYRSYLVNKYKLDKVEDKGNMPLNLEVLGAIKKVKSVLGFPMKLVQPLTTFKQAQQMVDELEDGGVSNIHMKYTGWFNGGINHSIPTKVKPERALGGKSGFKKLISAMNDKNIPLYPDVVFQRVYDGNIFNFIKSRDSVRGLAQKIQKVFPFSFIDYGRDFFSEGNWVLNSKSLERVVGKFLSSYEKYDNKAVSLKDLGTEVNSNFNRKAVTDRQQSKDYAVQELERMHKQGMKLMMNNANIYAIPYADTILNAPVDSSQFNLISQTVPFFQIALHGYVDYTGEPINLAQDYETTILRTIETGASLYYSLMYEDCSVVKNTEFTELYSTTFKDWKKDLLSVYAKVNPVLKDVQDKVIVDHKKLADGVFQTTYENGKAVMVNYNEKAVTINGTEIKAKGYAVIEGVEVE